MEIYTAQIAAKEQTVATRITDWFAAHPILRLTLIGLSLWLTFIALFYAEEDWRGKRDWEICRRAAEGNGRNLTWLSLIPPRVPDDQNFFAAPNMQQWFTGRGGNTLSAELSIGNFTTYLEEHGGRNDVAEITTIPDSAAAPPIADIVLDYKTARNRANATQLDIMIATAIDAATNGITGPTCESPLNFQFTASRIPAIKPLHIVLKSDDSLRSDEITFILPALHIKNFAASSKLSVRPTGANDFTACMGIGTYVPAKDFLAWSDTVMPDLETVREALKRPCARMDGEYDFPATIPIPNFVCCRIVAQFLVERTQCYLLLGEPEKALREQLFLRDLCRLMEGRPTSKPMTLVAAMINVAITGLYVQTLGDGLRLHVWREPELVALQKQLKTIDLETYVFSAFECESASQARILETTTPDQLADLFSFSRTQTLWDKMRDPIRVYCTFAPRGWIYQNMTRAVMLKEKTLLGFDSTNGRVKPKAFDDSVKVIEKDFARATPYNFLITQIMPNFTRATQKMAQNQTLVNEAYVACGLERYRLARGHYPETLDDLVPQFAEKIPADIVGGQPLKYRVNNGNFLLYSIGWNERDDGGKPAWSYDLTGDLAKNDWTWTFSE